jgi:hypothetical protein
MYLLVVSFLAAFSGISARLGAPGWAGEKGDLF